ncbi:GDP-mannose dehydrogenase, partial [Streptomyces sp. NPDC001156]
MKVSVFGLGYVGCVSAACLASMGHEVIGVDVNQVKVDLVNDGKAPVVEEGIGELVAEVVGTGGLRATGDVREA